MTNSWRAVLPLTRHQRSIHCESSRVVHGVSKRKWAPQTTRDTPEGINKPEYKRNWTDEQQTHKIGSRPFSNTGCGETLLYAVQTCWCKQQLNRASQDGAKLNVIRVGKITSHASAVSSRARPSIYCSVMFAAARAWCNSHFAPETCGWVWLFKLPEFD